MYHQQVCSIFNTSSNKGWEPLFYISQKQKKCITNTMFILNNSDVNNISQHLLQLNIKYKICIRIKLTYWVTKFIIMSSHSHQL